MLGENNNNKQQPRRTQKIELLYFFFQYFDLEQILCYDCFHYLSLIVNDRLA